MPSVFVPNLLPIIAANKVLRIVDSGDITPPCSLGLVFKSILLTISTCPAK